MAEIVPSDRELEILKALWRLGEASVRQVHEALYGGTDTGYTTTLKLLSGLTRREHADLFALLAKVKTHAVGVVDAAGEDA